MIDTKIIVIICVIGCLLVCYYFYNEISSMKKIVDPTYHKTMLMEHKMTELEKRTNRFLNKKEKRRNTQSPALTISYDTADMVKEDLSVKYRDISEKEARRIIMGLTPNRVKVINDEKELVPKELVPKIPEEVSLKLISDMQATNKELQQLYEGLDMSLSGSIHFSPDTIKYVSETAKYLDLPSEISDLFDLQQSVPKKKLGVRVLNKINIDPKKIIIKSH